MSRRPCGGVRCVGLLATVRPAATVTPAETSSLPMPLGLSTIDAEGIPGAIESAFPPAPAGSLLWLRFTDDVPVNRRVLAAAHAERARKMLGLAGQLRIGFYDVLGPGTAPVPGDLPYFAGEDGEEPAGMTPGGTIPPSIWIHNGLRGEALVGAVVHEVRHVAQDALRRRLDDREWRERDATAFMAAYVRGDAP